MAAQNKEASQEGATVGGVSSMTAQPLDPATEMKERLVSAVKKEVKQLMEEAVTRKFVHEDSGGVTTLCAAVEACLGQGLRRRALGLFKTSSTTALLHKIAKHCPEAAEVSRRVLAAEGDAAGSTRSASGECRSAPAPLAKRGSAGGLLAAAAPHAGQQQPRYLWIRLALFERQLARIIAHLVAHAPRYYERDALVADADYGSILSSLLVGPCALDYTRAKTGDYYWSDPPADELVQRHRISAGTTTPPSCRRPILNFRRSLNASTEDGMGTTNVNASGGAGVTSSVAHCAKDYVESLHQNSRATLLYGKNNVFVQPKDVAEAMPGYLSLHTMAQGLVIKWTPNQLMNGYTESETTTDKRRVSYPVVDMYECKYAKLFYTLSDNVTRRGSEGSLCLNCLYWQYALNVNVDEVVYVHCHQGSGGGSGGTLILVGQDGVQRPPIHFPKGGHLLAFLSCLETGLLPHGQLDPPLWSQRGSGKVFPRTGKVRRRPLPSLCESSSADQTEDADEAALITDRQASADYVFRIVNNNIDHQEFVAKHSLLERPPPRASPLSPRTPRCTLASVSTTSSDSSTMSVDNQLLGPADAFTTSATSVVTVPAQVTQQSASIALVCNTMRRQIISRAFYGWLAYCRHLSTVRTHLSGLVNPAIVPKDDAEGGLSEERWRQLTDEEGSVADCDEVYRLTYYGGVQHSIRKEVWPYLLGYYSFGSTLEARRAQDAACRRAYETTMSEWLCVEAIVRQRDREAQAASIAKLSEGSGGEAGNAANPNNELTNEVFEDNLSILSDDPPIISSEPSECETKNDVTMLSTAPSVDIEEDKEPDPKQAESKSSIDVEDSKDSQESEAKENTNLESETMENTNAESESKENTQETDEQNLNADNTFGSKNDAVNAETDDFMEEPSGIINPDLRRESEVEIRRLAEEIVQKGDGHGPQSSIDSVNLNGSESDTVQAETVPKHTSVIITNPSVDLGANNSPVNGTANVSPSKSPLGILQEESNSTGASFDTLDCPAAAVTACADSNKEGVRSNCVSPASSNGGVYTTELLESFALNLHRIEKDVQRCDRNYWYFTTDNLDKLRNIMCTYVWENLEVGYMQGMCDLVAPLLVILDEEAAAHACFARLMQRAIHNFPAGQAMDAHFANMRSLIQILDCEMYELMHAHGDYTHFYFCYRWFLLDFKRELLYQDVFSAWELIWAARHVASEHMVLFLALALLESYRDIILANSMDFTDIIKFFNEMAERHNSTAVLSMARDLVLQVQTLIENK